jgi:hypothetical protein
MNLKSRQTFIGGFAVTATLAGLASAGLAESLAADANLATNPSFEKSGPATLPEGWHGDSAVYASDATEQHSGKLSLRFENTDAHRYRLCSQKIPVRPGWKVRFGVWVKTKDITGDGFGATVCLDWQDTKGKWLGGSYPHGIKGTHDWTHIEEIARIPDDAGTVNLACYVRRGMTGTAWFDDVELVRVVDPPMQVIVRSPVYRGWITSQGPKEAQLQVRLDLRDYELRPDDVRVQALLCHPSGIAIWDSPALVGAKSLEVKVPVRDLPVGDYVLALRLTGPDGKRIQTADQILYRLPDDFHPRCRIDEHRRLIVDGKPYFPLGMYFSGIKEADLKSYSASKFNCLMPYQSPSVKQMDLAQSHNLKVIYSLKDLYFGSPWCPATIHSQADEEPLIRARVREFRSHPALLAWYLNDELSIKYLARLEAHQRWLAEEDRDHPTWSVLFQVDDIGAYINSFDCIGSDPYPIGTKPASLAAEWTAETFRQVARSRPVWQVPQAFNWSNYAQGETKDPRNHTPSYEQERSMAWQCICEGATGLLFYSWFDLQHNPDAPFAAHWEGLKRIAAEIDRMAPVLLSIEPAGKVKAEYAATSHGALRWLHCLTRQHEGKFYLFAVNDGNGEGAFRFTLPRSPRNVQVLGENRSISANGSVFQDDFRKLGVHIYEIEY